VAEASKAQWEVANGTPPSPGPVDALESLKIAIAATRSLKENRAVKLTEI